MLVAVEEALAGASGALALAVAYFEVHDTGSAQRYEPLETETMAERLSLVAGFLVEAACDLVMDLGDELAGDLSVHLFGRKDSLAATEAESARHAFLQDAASSLVEH